ncbi:unnamed protein product (macronuclear) [Paramecium tetraurelia]|uniref:Chromosome undetermined scaffold_39, whole genome shotgun sequence n=1 Tax=Paramecium tetraurelia TaxID=5888 RepID=Q3SEL3_PARTE|nr:uncharacterized protein GSPATT00013774001 [Paramecium tetraurelia]CAH74210.1 dynamin-related protein, putative [Paramecium tetraurelia]CAK78344.1 unnamed protein product [Paramecium tetraurelia]|eukprot:XP_001445741.1 hypothetical protein (macronuclear) [Paramecium tetraurelia strain d4-2]
MEKLIPFINDLHDILSSAGLSNELNLPSIVVIGSQSVGKSSLLESIVGREFLPRGKGIVTRRPIEIQLHQVIDAEQSWFEFMDKRGEKIFESDEIRKLIEQETDKVAGKNKGISPVAIKVKYFSKDILNLQLIDLPGITKNPVGDQPQDIEQKVLDIVLPFIKNQNSLILAVSKASDDLATSDGLKLARSVDPNGLRTIGVITQLDLMDEGSDILNDLLNQTYPLQLGYVGVIMRGQKDIQKNKTIQNQLKDEKEFFESHKIYKKYSEKMGIGYLVKTLNMNFIQHIKRALPVIRETIISLAQMKEYELKQYGDYDNLESKETKNLLVLTLISKFSNSYKDMLEGRCLDITSKELIGGSRIIYVFNETFRRTIQKMNPFDVLSDDEIRTAIKNANGIRPSLFVPQGAFELLVRQQIQRLRMPSIECSHIIFEELRRVINQISIPEIERFDVLSNRIQEVIENLLNKCLIQTDEIIQNLLEIEIGYINTSHPDFVSGMDLVNREEQRQQPQQIIREKSPVQSESESGKFLNFWPFKNNKQTELYDSKLDILNNKRKQNTLKPKKLEQIDESQILQQQSVINKIAYVNQQYYVNDPKRQLPCVPNVIKLNDRPSKREQTEMDMIKDLIVSYFNLVKKNICDSIPKTIITFLVNQSRNLCERELIGVLYKSDSVDELLQENQFIQKSRKETKQTLISLKTCLNLLNELDQKF